MNDETLIPAKLVDYLSDIPDAEEPDGLERALTATRQERRAFDMEDDLVNSTHSSSSNISQMYSHVQAFL